MTHRRGTPRREHLNNEERSILILALTEYVEDCTRAMATEDMTPEIRKQAERHTLTAAALLKRLSPRGLYPAAPETLN